MRRAGLSTCWLWKKFESLHRTTDPRVLPTIQTVGGSAEERRSDKTWNEGAVLWLLESRHQFHEGGAGGQLDAHGVVSILQLAVVSLSRCFVLGQPLLLVVDVSVGTADLATDLRTEQRLLEQELEVVREHVLLEAGQQGAC